MARSVISGEAWFSIANEMLVHDAYEQDRKPSRQPGPPARRGRDADPARAEDAGRRHPAGQPANQSASQFASQPANHLANHSASQVATPLAH